MNNGPILIVDDDKDDWEFLQDAWQDLEFENPLLFFSSGQHVLDYMKSGKASPFLILCDVNIPGIDGFELKKRLSEDPSTRYKSIPFVFWSTAVSKSQIQKAYDLGGHGFFLKENSLPEIKNSLAEMVKYWLKSIVPE